MGLTFVKKFFWQLGILASCALVFFLAYYSQTKGSYIDFSDAAKYGDAARNLINGNGYASSFVFWRGYQNGLLANGFFETAVLPVYTFFVAVVFKVFGISDIALVGTTALFYILSTLLVFLVGKKMFGGLVGLFTSLAFALTPDILNYAANGGSEMIFITEILLVFYLVLINMKYSAFLAAFFSVLMYFTRPQGFIYILGICFFWLLTKHNIKKSIALLALVILIGLTIDKVILGQLEGKYFIYSIINKGAFSATTLGAGGSPSDILRASALNFGFLDLSKKVFYNLYNFYRLAPQIVNPYMLSFFAIALFVRHKDKTTNAFKLASLFTIGLTLLVGATAIPLFRYIHPIIPLVYLLAIDVLVRFVNNIVNDQWPVIKKLVSTTKFMATLVISFVLVFIFIGGKALGIIFLDSRFERQAKNFEKPPLYVAMSLRLRENTSKDEIVLTNLDTWGSWYGERKTVWFPLTPRDINLGDGKVHFDAIYLTSYLMNDSNYFMGEEWRQIFDNPQNIENAYIKTNYEFAGEYEFTSSGNFDNENGKAVLLKRKT